MVLRSRILMNLHSGRLLSLTANLALALAAVFASGASRGDAQRVLGLDVSAWQGNISSRTWSRFRSIGNRDFVFIRSSRGGTTGFYDQSDPGNQNGQNTLSQRYDDPYFALNMTRSTNAGLLAGPYHFSRPDIVSNTGADEADHFIEMAGAWMRPGYLLPVHDLEAGEGFRSDNGMAQFALDFSDRVFEVMGIRPAIYLNGNYAHNVIGGASVSLKNEVVDTYPVMWMARPENNADVQNEDPSDYLSWTYGAWDDPPNPTHPWSFWQYSWTGQISGYNGNLDFNVANGGMEYLKDHLVPALWTGAGSGDWSTLANWNSGQEPIAPVQGPGQVPRVGTLTLPDVRLPAANDTVILDPPGGSIVTLASGDHEIRKLVTHEELHVTGGSLTINYVPHAESTPYSALFSAPVSLDGGTLSAHTLMVDATQTFSFGGTLTFDELQLSRHATAPARIDLIGDVVVHPLDDATASVVVGGGSGSPGLIDLGGMDRTWEVSDGTSEIDLSIQVEIINGGLTKTGAGTLDLALGSDYDGDTSVLDGVLNLDRASLADTADVYLASTAALELDFAGTDTVDALFIDDVPQPAGVWGALGSGAQFTSAAIIGPGLLEVSTTAITLPGDFDLDGDVDGADLAKWQTEFGISDGSDADVDGDSDGNDYLAWQSNFGLANGSAIAARVVPEPTSATISLSAALLTLVPRCGRVRARQSQAGSSTAAGSCL